MSRETERAKIAMGRRFGASPEARERMDAANAEAIWQGKCRHCGVPLKGTLKQLKDHVCENG